VFLVDPPILSGGNAGFGKATLTGFLERLGSENNASVVAFSARRRKVRSRNQILQ
jgi:hypothetical protein